MRGSASVRETLRPLAKGLVHKLRNSLNTMQNYISILEKHAEKQADSRFPQQLEKLHEAVGTMENVLDEFIALADPGSNDKEEVSMVSLIKEVLDSMGGTLAAGGVRVVAQFGPAMPAVCGSRARFKKAILSLLLNAREAMPNGGRLSVVAKKTARGGIVVEIGDTGEGIPEEDQKRVFQPFYSTKPGGLGLGLAVTKQTIEDSGGKIGFQSRAGLGTTFQVSLPAVRRRRRPVERKSKQRKRLQYK